MNSPALFELSDVAAGPVDDPILQGITLNIPCRGVTAFAGPSGAGKSTLLRLLNRLDDPIDGSIRWEQRDLHEWNPQQLRRRVAMVFQRPPLFGGSVLDNLCVADPDLDRGSALAALERVGLDAVLLDRNASDLSGGEAQRMCIARALLTEPAVLLADEPTSSLDGAARRTVEELFRSIADDDGVAIVWVTHDVEQLRRMADHVVVLVDGGVAATGDLAELDEHPDARVRDLVGTTG